MEDGGSGGSRNAPEGPRGVGRGSARAGAGARAASQGQGAGGDGGPARAEKKVQDYWGDEDDITKKETDK